MPEPTAADVEVVTLAAQLRKLREDLGDAYWRDPEVRALQAQLRSRIGGYGAWGADKLPMHQRLRMAAKYESELAALLWPR
jgi:hypothetical protein